MIEFRKDSLYLSKYSFTVHPIRMGSRVKFSVRKNNSLVIFYNKDKERPGKGIKTVFF
jgi:hypothetical protein